MRLPAVASNPPVIVIGILDIPSQILRPMGESEASKAEVLAEKPTAEFRETLFSMLVQAPKKGDEIIALDRDGVPHYRVLDAKPDGVSHIICQLAPL